jgi:hypothetical protein
MMFDPTKKWAIPGENEHTHLTTNAADSIFNVSSKLPGIHVGNVAGIPIRPMLMNPDSFAFRPKPGSALEKAGAGAFASSQAQGWTPGVRAGMGGPLSRGVESEARGNSDVICRDAQCAHWDAVRRETIR